jgi:hypothetical protein
MSIRAKFLFKDHIFNVKQNHLPDDKSFTIQNYTKIHRRIKYLFNYRLYNIKQNITTNDLAIRILPLNSSLPH